jgi:sulfite exporter TauE/SafE
MSSTDTLYLVFLVTGFTVGFGHCIGMCGPIVVSLSLNLKGRSVFLPQLLYNAGRVITYAVLGGLAGILGSFTILTSSILSLQKGVLIFAGLVVLLMGLGMGGWISLGRLFGDGGSSGSLLSKWFNRLSSAKSPRVYLPLGLLLGLLPCGPVYTALIASARAGMEAQTTLQGFLSGAVLMIAFGIGTVPALLLVGKLAGLRWIKSRHLIYKISSVLTVLVGIYFIIQGIRY